MAYALFLPRHAGGIFMVQTDSLFSRLLHEVPRNEFARLVNTHQGDQFVREDSFKATCQPDGIIANGSINRRPSLRAR